MRAIIVLCAFSVMACGPDHRNNGNGCPGICSALGYQACNSDGSYAPPVECGPDQTCDPNLGCIVCAPDSLYCSGDSDNTVYRCNHDGTGGTPVMDCPGAQVCSMGACKSACDAALDNPSNVGCDFWAADLKNDVSTIGTITTDACAMQFAIVVANNNDYPVTVTVTENAGRVGAPPNEQTVITRQVSPGIAERIDLPQREVDGSMGQNGTYVQRGGSGTFVSPHAYHVVTDGPVVVYQFNPIVQAFSNDASTLLPIQALGQDYALLGFDTANPCGLAGLAFPGVPDHTSITVIPTQDNTTVTVTASHPIRASGGDSGIAIPQTPKGMPLTFNLSRYDVANLSSDQPDMVSAIDCSNALHAGQNGDFTGSLIHADKPVLVFTSGERAEGFGGVPQDQIQYPPDWDIDMDHVCCTDHVEEQLLPVTALGKDFAIARSPVRSMYPDWVEPDVIRVLATVDNTHVTTNLDPPNDAFSLMANQQKTFLATSGFAMTSDQPVEVNSFLVPAQFIKDNPIGDASQLTLPAAEQFRKSYVFLVPATWQDNYMTLAKPADAMVILDGMPLAMAEFSNCYTGPIGMVAGTMYDQITCKLADGQHSVSADKPFGLSVFGYYAVGSYAFVGGSDVKIINPIF